MSSGPARLVTICPRSSFPSPGPSGEEAGHQLYVLKMTVSNKCLLIFFQGLCAAEFVLKRGVGSFRASARGGSAELRVPAVPFAQLCGTCSCGRARRALCGAGPGTTATGGPCGQPRPAVRRAALELHGGAPSLHCRPPRAAAPCDRRQARPAGGEKRDSAGGPVGAARRAPAGAAHAPSRPLGG